MSTAKMAKPIDMSFGELTLVGPRNHILDGGHDPPMGKGNFGCVWPIEKHCCGVHGKRDHSVLNNGMKAVLLQPTAVLQTGWVSHCIAPCEKSALLLKWPFIKIL